MKKFILFCFSVIFNIYGSGGPTVSSRRSSDYLEKRDERAFFKALMAFKSLSDTSCGCLGKSYSCSCLGKSYSCNGRARSEPYICSDLVRPRCILSGNILFSECNEFLLTTSWGALVLHISGKKKFHERLKLQFIKNDGEKRNSALFGETIFYKDNLETQIPEGSLDQYRGTDTRIQSFSNDIWFGSEYKVIEIDGVPVFNKLRPEITSYNDFDAIRKEWQTLKNECTANKLAVKEAFRKLTTSGSLGVSSFRSLSTGLPQITERFDLD